MFKLVTFSIDTLLSRSHDRFCCSHKLSNRISTHILWIWSQNINRLRSLRRYTSSFTVTHEQKKRRKVWGTKLVLCVLSTGLVHFDLGMRSHPFDSVTGRHLVCNYAYHYRALHEWKEKWNQQTLLGIILQLQYLQNG